ncbi:MAG: class I SAM-dependent methyltransferase [Parvibaculales bacterium]
MKLPIDIDTVKGFLDPDEGRALYETLCALEVNGPAVEIGSYCGKSTVYLGTACRVTGRQLVAVDHHYGSEENQPGEGYFDPELADAATGGMSSLAHFRETMRRAKLEDVVVPIVAPSSQAAPLITQALAFVFIDGGHSMSAAFDDYRLWTGKLAPGGVLAIHDVFPNPADGGRPPHEIYKMAMASDLFVEAAVVKSLRILKRL